MYFLMHYIYLTNRFKEEYLNALRMIQKRGPFVFITDDN